MQQTEIPLFPLNTVLFPGGVLPLRIFERRYLEMVSNCMKNAGGFGVVAIQEGREAGEKVRCHGIGTLARIVDFDRLEDGLLGITCVGEQRVRVLAQRVQDDRLLLGQVEWLPAEPDSPLPRNADLLLTLLKNILSQEEIRPYTRFLVPDWDSAAWVGNRLAEILPLPLEVKQALLVLSDPVQRLDVVNAMLREQQPAQ